jgi:hypothetical protein
MTVVHWFGRPRSGTPITHCDSGAASRLVISIPCGSRVTLTFHVLADRLEAVILGGLGPGGDGFHPVSQFTMATPATAISIASRPIAA